MKNLIKFTLIFFIFNFYNTAKSEILEGFCLVKKSDLEIAKIAPDDFPRFLGKEIKILVSLEEGLLADISDDVDLSLITGMYGGTLEFKKNGLNINYENKIEVGEKPKQVTYSYKNRLSLVDNKITSIYAYVDQTGFSMNSWKFQIDCRDYPYSEDEILAAKKTKTLGKYGKPEWFDELVKKIEKGDIQKRENPYTTEITGERREIGSKEVDSWKKSEDNSKYSLLIEEDFDTALFLRPGSVTIISFGGYEFFKGVYNRSDNQANTHVQPADMSKDGKMESYMRDGSQVEFDWEFKERDNDQIVISSTSKFIQVLNSYVASDSSFSISSITDEFWYAGTFDLVKNQDDLLRIYQKNKATYCSIIKEKPVLYGSSLELQYKHSDFINFNKRNNISC